MGRVNVCFIANYHKTEYFSKIADRLMSVNSEIDVYWVTVNQAIERKLSKQYGGSKVLRIGLDLNKNDGYSDVVINDLVRGDRILRNFVGAIDYLKKIQRPIIDFFVVNKISLVFGELTWAHELMVFRLVQKKLSGKCKYLNPHTVRIPSGFFGFFVDEFQSELYMRVAFCSCLPKIKKSKPDYLRQNNIALSKHFSFAGRVSRFYNFITRNTYDKNDPTMFRSMLGQFVSRIITEINSETWRFVKKRKAEDFFGSDFVCVFLHKQPEASIDVVGRYYEDQLINIINIWRSLPEKWILLIKEHSNAIGDRSLGFYRSVLNLNNTFIVGSSEDSYKLIEHAKLVISVSGTVCYESALASVRSLTFSPMFFNNLKFSNRLSLDELRRKTLYDLYNEDLPGLGVDEFGEWLSHRVFPGEVGDGKTSPQVLLDANIETVASAFCEVINDLGVEINNFGTV